MNFTETVEALAKKGGYTKKLSEEVIKHYEEVIIEGLLSGDGTLRLGNSGTFKIVKRAARKGKNPRTQEPLDIPARNAIVFKPGKVWNEKVN